MNDIVVSIAAEFSSEFLVNSHAWRRLKSLSRRRSAAERGLGLL